MSVHGTRVRRVRLKGIVSSHHEAITLATEPGDVAIVKRDVARSFVMRCPDCCGEAITLNLDARTDKAWRVYQSARGLTLFPSVWRDTGCHSHFIVWNDVIWWVDFFDMEKSDWEEERRLLEERVWRTLRPDALTDFVQIADVLTEIPWAVLDACRGLVRSGRAAAGEGSMKNSFRRS